MKHFKGFWSRHSEWINSFGSNFLATVLGIVLTFGVSEWLEHRERQEAAEMLVERSFANIEERLKTLKMVKTTLNRGDSLLKLCSDAIPDKIDSVPDEIYKQLIRSMDIRWELFTSKSVEIGFKQDINSQRVLGPFADVLSEAFEVVNYGEEANQEVNAFKLRFERESTNIIPINSPMASREDRVRFLSKPESVFCLTQVSVLNGTINSVTTYLENYMLHARRLWNKEITYEEFEKIARKEVL